jgi:ribosomal protein L37AE/L43A
MGHTLKRNPLTGAVRVHYKCPACKTDLNARLEEAGVGDKCPECKATYTVPGAEELAARRAEQRRAEEEAERKRVEDAAQQAELERRRAQVAAAHQVESQRAFAREREAALKKPITDALYIPSVIAVLVGIVLLLVGVFMDASVPTESGFGRVNNIGLMGTKILAGMVGGLLVVCGAVLRATVAIGAEINRWGRALLAEAGQRHGPT